MTTKTVQIKLEGETYKTIAKAAIDEEVSLSSFITGIVLEALGVEEEEVPEPTPEPEPAPAPKKRRRRKTSTD